MTCWCDSNNKEKTAAIDSSNSKIAQLESSMGSSAARIAELKQTRKETLDEVNADHKALMDASGMRMKENKEFQASETDYLEAIDAAKNAIIVLSKHNPQLTQLRTVAHRLLEPRVSQLMSTSGRIGRASVDYLDHFLHNA